MRGSQKHPAQSPASNSVPFMNEILAFKTTQRNTLTEFQNISHRFCRSRVFDGLTGAPSFAMCKRFKRALNDFRGRTKTSIGQLLSQQLLAVGIQTDVHGASHFLA